MRQYYSNNKNYKAILESMAQIRQNQLNEMHGDMHSDEEEMQEAMHDDEEEMQEAMHGDEEETEEGFMYEMDDEDEEALQEIADMLDEALEEVYESIEQIAATTLTEEHIQEGVLGKLKNLAILSALTGAGLASGSEAGRQALGALGTTAKTVGSEAGKNVVSGAARALANAPEVVSNRLPKSISDAIMTAALNNKMDPS